MTDTNAEGHAASLRQFAKWTEAEVDWGDPDELRAAADFIEYQAAEIERLRAKCQEI